MREPYRLVSAGYPNGLNYVGAEGGMSNETSTLRRTTGVTVNRNVIQLAEIDDCVLPRDVTAGRTQRRLSLCILYDTHFIGLSSQGTSLWTADLPASLRPLLQVCDAFQPPI